MGSLLVGIFSAIGTVAGDIAKAFGGSKTQGSKNDEPTDPGTGADDLKNNQSFHDAVQAKHTGTAANTAASVLTTKAKGVVDDKARASSQDQQKVAAQLLAVKELLDPCYGAEDWVFAINQVVTSGASLDPVLRHLLNDWWNSADGYINRLVKISTDFKDLDPSWSGAFEEVLTFKANPPYKQIGDDLDLKNEWSNPPMRLGQNTSGLLGKLQDAVQKGVDLIETIADAMNQASSTKSTDAQPADTGVASDSAHG